MIIGTVESYKLNMITVSELLAVLKTATKIPTCVQYKGTLEDASGYVYCDLHFYQLSTLGCKAWTEESGSMAYTARKFRGWREVNEFLIEIVQSHTTRNSVINDTAIINRVYYPGSNVPLTPLQLALESGAIFKPSGFSEQISGNGHCDCEHGGEFELLPKDDPAVLEGGKRYMQCRICGGWSHL